MDAVMIVAYGITIAIPLFTVYLFIALDLFGTGKPYVIIGCLLYGATVAFYGAKEFNNTVIEQGIEIDTLARSLAPIIEELLKALILIILIQLPLFRYVVDGAVYGIAVGTGFAMSENLFIYIPNAEADAVAVAISRTLSTALMHASASGLVGISLGRLRRSTGAGRNTYPILGILLAITLHMIYNNLAYQLEDTPQILLLVAIGIGVGSGAYIAWQITQGLEEEKQRFAETLGLEVDVSTGERKAIQNLGGEGIEQVFDSLTEFFGEDNLNQIRRMLTLQANIGILQNNLRNADVSDRLRNAWEQEVDEYQEEVEQIRKKLGRVVANFMATIFPSDDTMMQDQLNQELGQYDPTRVHTFDMFMRTSGLAETFTSEELIARAERLNRIEIFHNVSLANLENLSRAIDMVTFDNKVTLFEEGDAGDAMYLVEAGELAIFVANQPDPDKPLRVFKAGDVVGEFSLLDGGARTATARAIGELKVLRLQREVFNQFIQSRPRVVLAMLQYLVGKARETTHIIENSTQAIHKIEMGDYQEVCADTVAIAQDVTTDDETLISLEPTDLTAEKASLVFSTAALRLQQREEALRS